MDGMGLRIIRLEGIRMWVEKERMGEGVVGMV